MHKKDFSGYFKHVKTLPDGSLAICIIEAGKIAIIPTQKLCTLTLNVSSRYKMNYLGLCLSSNPERSSDVDSYVIICPDEEHMHKLLETIGFADVSLQTNKKEGSPS